MNLNDMNWKTWGFIFLIALGMSFELLKRIPSNSKWNVENLKPVSERPYAVKGRISMMQHRLPPAIFPAGKMQTVPKYTPPAMTKEQLAQLVAQQNKGAEGQATEGPEAKKKKDGDEWEVIIDPKTGKKMKRRKKKEAKKEDKKVEEKKLEAKHEPEKTNTTENDIDIALVNSHTTGQLTPPPPADKPDDAFEGAEEWARKLLGRPDLAETNRFIDHHNRNLVSDEVFYQIVGQMLEDSRMEMKKLGILCLSQTRSVVSFNMLAQVTKNERPDSPIRQEADKALDVYGKEFSRVGILEKVMKGGAAPYTILIATRKLEDSAKLNLSKAPDTAPTQVSQAQASTARNRVTTYQRFLTVLTGLSRSSDSGVKTQATQTLTVLKGLLNSTTATAGQPQAPAAQPAAPTT